MPSEKRKKISVITTTFNLIKGKRKDVFVEMFRSVHSQTYPNIEHLIIDGGSKDGTIETLSLLVNFSGESFLERNRMEDMLEMRMAIEGKAVERLAETLTKESVALLEEDIQRAEKTAAEKADPHSLALCFFDFHHDICFVSGNFILPLLFNSFRTVTLTYWEHAIRFLGREKCIQLMKDLLEVLKEKNALE